MMRDIARSFAVVSAMALAIASGCSKSEKAATDAHATTTTTQLTRMSNTLGNVDRGKIVFHQNCSVCHGASGTEGGVGPSLRDEKTRKNYDMTLAWIKDPAPPMPKLFPSPLSEQEVDDVAAYVQSL